MEKVRTVITTDMECDDMNSMIHICLHLNDLDVQGIVYTASKYHFNGDGIHTLGEVTPHYSCSGRRAYETEKHPPGPDPAAKDLKEYRPFEEGWIESLFKNEYASVWPNLCRHDPDYPSPEEMLSRIYYGNIAFEGDVRNPTEGSEFIRKLMLDEDERLLYIQSWGGINTVVRALMTIEEEYKNSEQWQDVYGRVCQKVRILGVIDGKGQDNSWLDHAADTWKDIVLLRSEFGYGGFFSSVSTQPDSIDTYKAPWLKENIKFNHGPLMEKTILMGDGTYIKGEPENRQFGQMTYIDFGLEMMPRVDFDRYDWLGEGDSMTWVPLLPNGLRGLEDGRYGTVAGRLFNDGEEITPKRPLFGKPEDNINPFLYAFQKEWAARADWCVRAYDECPHPPVITAAESDIDALAGESITPAVTVSSADGRPVQTRWFVYEPGTVYQGERTPQVLQEEDGSVSFRVPDDSTEDDQFIIYAAAETEGFPSFTRYAGIAVHVR